MFVAIREMRRRKGRFALLSGAIALLVILLLFFQAVGGSLQSGLTDGLRHNTAEVVVYSGTARKNPNASFLPTQIVEPVSKIDGVAKAAGVVKSTFAIKNSPADITTIGLEKPEIGGPQKLSDGRLPSNPGEAVAANPNFSATQLKFSMNETVTVQGVELKIVGIAEKAEFDSNPTLYALVDDVHKMAENKAGKTVPASYSWVAVTTEEGADPADVAKRISDQVTMADLGGPPGGGPPAGADGPPEGADAPPEASGNSTGQVDTTQADTTQVDSTQDEAQPEGQGDDDTGASAADGAEASNRQPVALVALRKGAASSATTISDTTVPETTVPETAIPETTLPDTTTVETTTPETTIGQTTQPDATSPESTRPGDGDESGQPADSGANGAGGPPPGASEGGPPAGVSGTNDSVEALTRSTAADNLPGFSLLNQSFDILYLLLFIAVTIVTGVFFLILTVQKKDSLVLMRAMGASRADTVRLVMIEVVTVVGIGSVVGVVVAGSLLYLLRNSFGATLSVATTAGSVVAILVLGILASFGAVRRVLAIDPVQAARQKEQ